MHAHMFVTCFPVDLAADFIADIEGDAFGKDMPDIFQPLALSGRDDGNILVLNMQHARIARLPARHCIEDRAIELHAVFERLSRSHRTMSGTGLRERASRSWPISFYTKDIYSEIILHAKDGDRAGSAQRRPGCGHYAWRCRARHRRVRSILPLFHWHKTGRRPPTW